MSENETTTHIARRTVLKGAAWSVPVVAATAATPLAAASQTPGCPTCLAPQLGAYTLTGTAAGSLGNGTHATLALTTPSVIDATGCGSLITSIFSFQPAFSFVTTSAILTMSDGSTYNSTVGLATGDGVLGGVGALGNAMVFTNVKVDTRNVVVLGVPNIRAVSLTVNFTATYKWGLGLTKLTCQHSLTWNLPGLGLIAGVGLVNVVTYDGVTTA